MTRHRLVAAATTIALIALAAPGAASAADRDHDKMRDSWEKRHGLSTKRNDARKDKDRDRVRNLQEYRLGTDPDDRDSDDDGIRDDRENAGTIKSFDPATGVLVIDLYSSDSDLTGKVDDRTEIECEDGDELRDDDDHRGDGTREDDSRSRDSADDDDDDRSGTSSGSSGDDREDDGDEGPGDDRGDDDADDHGDRDEAEERCSTDELDAGRIVHEAEIHTVGGEAIFEEVELIK